jgi:glutathione S-transferase
VREWLDVAQARSLPGLRLVLTVGVPGPWGEAAKGLFFAKRIGYTRVRQAPGEPNAELRAWTGFDNAPQAVWQDEPARIAWTELIFLAERLAPEPALVPPSPAERAQMFGLAHELAGENGLGWSRRLMMLHGTLSLPASALPEGHPVRARVQSLARKYGYSAAAAQAAPARAAGILRLLSDQLAGQQRLGRRFLVGERLSALDIYWAAFAALVSPLPADQCAMPAGLRQAYEISDPALRSACSPELLAHRDFVYREHLELPIDL